LQQWEKTMMCQFSLFGNVGSFPFHKLVNGTVLGIEPYYTFIKTKEGLMVGTPYSLSERKPGNG
jgi:hypothetical protein